MQATVNAINWEMKKQNKEVFDYVKALIQLRKEHPSFRMTRVEQIKKFIHFDMSAAPGTIAFTIDGFAVKDKWKKIFVVYNGNNSFTNIKFPS